jgi:NTP pyrophosphatase (non-canonical NTP hydrolase)
MATIKEVQARALEIAEKYRVKGRADGRQQWDSSGYMAGFVGDVGDLSKLVMAQNGYRHIDNADKKIAHELSDCLWSVLVLAHHLNVDIESEFFTTMEELEVRISGDAS